MKEQTRQKQSATIRYMVQIAMLMGNRAGHEGRRIGQRARWAAVHVVFDRPYCRGRDFVGPDCQALFWALSSALSASRTRSPAHRL